MSPLKFSTSNRIKRNHPERWKFGTPGNCLNSVHRIKVVTVRFLNQFDIKKCMNVGQKSFIVEGARTLGYGEILEVLAKFK